MVRDDRRPAGELGQALVEFALVAPFFFLLLFGIIEAGRFVVYYETLSNATREGARYAIVHGSNSFCPSGPMPPSTPAPSGCYDRDGNNVTQRVRESAFGLLGSGVTVKTFWDPQPQVDGTYVNGPLGNGRESAVKVTARYTYAALIPLVPLPSITVSAESNLVVNN